MSRLLALDISNSVGWALLERGCDPRWGTWPMPVETVERYERRGAALWHWLQESVSVFQPHAIAAEAPLIPNSHNPVSTTTDTVIFLSGSVYIAGAVAGDRGLRFERVHHDDAKIALLGTARNVKKIDMIAACFERGWRVQNDHEADAIGVGLHIYDEIFPPRAAA